MALPRITPDHRPQVPSDLLDSDPALRVDVGEQQCSGSVDLSELVLHGR